MKVVAFALQLFVLQLLVPAQGSPVDDKIRALQILLTKDPAGSVRYASVSVGLSMNSGPQMNEAGLETILDQIVGNATSEDVRKAAYAVLDEIVREKQEKQEAYTSRIETSIGKVSDLLGKAQKPDDLDAILLELQSIPVPPGAPFSLNPDEQAQNQRLTTALLFVTSWQDYLSALVRGKDHDAQGALQNLLNGRQEGQPWFVPRSHILDCIAILSGEKTSPPSPSNAQPGVPAPKVDADLILTHVQKLDDMATAYKNITALGGTPDPKTQADLASLTMFISVYNDAEEGFPVNLNVGNFSNGPTLSADISRIKSMLLLYLVPKYLEVSGSSLPREKETIAEYLNRTRDAAVQAKDWMMLQKVLGIQVSLRNMRAALGPDAPGVQFFIVGLNDETAMQYASAVFSYECALKTPDDLLPAKIIGDRLESIRTAHPKEFAEGFQKFSALGVIALPYARSPSVYRFEPWNEDMPWTTSGFPQPMQIPAAMSSTKVVKSNIKKNRAEKSKAAE